MKNKVLIILMAVMFMFVLSACGKKESSKDVPMADIHNAVKTAYGESYIPSMEYDETAVKDIFGIDKDMYDEIIAEGPMMSVHVDTFIAVKAKKDRADEVEELLKNYKKNNMEQAMQYPMNIGKISGASIHRVGNYVFFLQLGEISMEAEEQGEEAVIKAAEDQNQIGIDAINKLFE